MVKTFSSTDHSSLDEQVNNFLEKEMIASAKKKKQLVYTLHFNTCSSNDEYGVGLVEFSCMVEVII